MWAQLLYCLTINVHYVSDMYSCTCVFYMFINTQFVAHPNIQQLLASLWYEGVPGFRRKSAIQKLFIIFRVVVFFPLYCAIYIVAPNCGMGKLMRKPFMKFLIHASAYLFFLCKPNTPKQIHPFHLFFSSFSIHTTRLRLSSYVSMEHCSCVRFHALYKL